LIKNHHLGRTSTIGTISSKRLVVCVKGGAQGGHVYQMQMSRESGKLSKQARKNPHTEPVVAAAAPENRMAFFISDWSSSHTNCRWYKP
jgi:hypothetical protein